MVVDSLHRDKVPHIEYWTGCRKCVGIREGRLKTAVGFIGYL